MRRLPVVALLGLALLFVPESQADACSFTGIDLESALDPATDVGVRTVGIVERQTVEAAPYLGLRGPRSISAIARSWGRLPTDTSPGVDGGACGEHPRPKGRTTYFVVYDDGSTGNVYLEDSEGDRVTRSKAEAMIAARFGQPSVHELGFGTRARIVADLWLLPLVIPVLALALAAAADRKIGLRQPIHPWLAAAAVAAGVVLGVALSFPNPGWATIRFVGGYLALAVLALWAGSRGATTTIILVMGTVLFGVGSGTLAGRVYAAASSALGIALLIEGLAIHATALDRALLRFGHVCVAAGAALVGGAIWVRGTLGGNEGHIARAVFLAVIAAVLWSWWIERGLAKARMLRRQSTVGAAPDV